MRATRSVDDITLCPIAEVDTPVAEGSTGVVRALKNRGLMRITNIADPSTQRGQAGDDSLVIWKCLMVTETLVAPADHPGTHIVS